MSVSKSEHGYLNTPEGILPDCALCHFSCLFSLFLFLHPSPFLFFISFFVLVFILFYLLSPTLLQVIKALPVHPLGGRVLSMVTEP